MGPAVSVYFLYAPDLTKLDQMLARHCEKIDRTRKGRTWTLWVSSPWVRQANADARPIYAQLTGQTDLYAEELAKHNLLLNEVSETLALVCGLNDPIDYQILADLSREIAKEFRVKYGPPVK